MKTVFRVLAFFGAIVLGLGLFLFVGKNEVTHDTEYGITWSKPYAESLGLDSMDGLRATLDDLGVRRFRIPAYWSEVEPTQGVYTWTSLEQQLDAISQRQGKIILVVGAKQPRWPEYWIPDWAKALPPLERDKAQLDYVEETVKFFSKYPAIEAWQVENESQFPFGTGAERQSRDFVKQEMALVHRLCCSAPNGGLDRSVYTTDSGELSLWLDFRHEINGLGISVYRTVVNPWIGVWRYGFWPSFAYDRKWQILHLFGTAPFYVSEFQMEPWGLKPLTQSSLDEQFKSFDFEQMKQSFAYAERLPTQLHKIYFWGAEWWYWMKIKFDHPEFWNTAKEFFKKSG